MRFIYMIILVDLCLSAFPAVHAQDIKNTAMLEVTVKDNESAPIGGALVTLPGTDFEIRPGGTGRAVFQLLAPDTHRS